MRSQLIPAEVTRWSRLLGITEYLDRKSGAYSGGNKRKLNVAMALVSEPPVLCLDEPSTGVDPVARRRLWRVIQAVQRNGQSVVLTSHRLATIEEETYRRKGKGRRCWLGDVLECGTSHLAARMIWTNVFGWTPILVGWWYGDGVNQMIIYFSEAFILPSVHSSINPFLYIILVLNL